MLKEEPDDICLRTKGKHQWEYFIPELLPPWIKEKRQCQLCGAIQGSLVKK